MSELILELFSEEIPAKIQNKFIASLEPFTEKYFLKSGFIGDFEFLITPRRVTILVQNLVYAEDVSKNLIRGPKINANEQAIQGFLAKCQLQDISKLTIQDVGKEKYYFYKPKLKKQTIAVELTVIINKLIPEIVKLWPKTMRWNQTNARWIRPLRNILCLYNQEILAINYADLSANNLTYGHRFLGVNKALEIKGIASYKNKLAKDFVVLSQIERQKLILTDLENLCAKHKLTLHQDQDLLAEVTGLVEYPVILMGEIAPNFMELPEEVLITTLKNHQKYFCTRNCEGKLAPYFIFVSNNNAASNKIIINGNERVLKARLADAEFFYQEDLKNTISSRFNDLEKIIFHKDIGNLRDQSEANAVLAKYIAIWVKNSHLVDIEVAARLAKADLTTEMVGEFPELQGVMGCYYAKAENLSPAIANAIRDHYKPRFLADNCPVEPTALCVALADRINNLVSLTLVGEKASGSKDPYGLRRSAIAIVKIILEQKINLPLNLILDKSLSNYNFLQKQAIKFYPDIEPKQLKLQLKNELIVFVFDKLRNLLKEQNIAHDIINAVFNNYAIDDLSRIYNICILLANKLNTIEGQRFLAAYNRAANIYLKAESVDGVSYNKRLHLLMWREESEKHLYATYKNVKSALPNLLKEHNYEDAFLKITELTEPIESFFQKLVINDNDKNVRQNRLKLLATLCNTVNNFANFSKIEKSFNNKN